MPTLSQTKLSLGSQRHFRTRPAPLPPSPPPLRRVCRLRFPIVSSAMKNPKIEPTNLLSPQGLNDPSLCSTWSHRACLASGCAAVGISLAKCIAGAAAGSGNPWLGPALAGVLGYVLADLGTGVYHWGIDNYGNPSIPFVGPQIERAQGHHRWPSTISRRQAANNLHAAALGVAVAVFPVNILCDDPAVHGFVSVFAGCVMFSQQFHAWAHSSQARLPPPVVALQNLGVLLSPSQHAVHHRGSNDGGYCIVSGLWNEFLDRKMAFKALEMLLFLRFGVRPQSWGEPGPELAEMERV